MQPDRTPSKPALSEEDRALANEFFGDAVRAISLEFHDFGRLEHLELWHIRRFVEDAIRNRRLVIEGGGERANPTAEASARFFRELYGIDPDSLEHGTIIRAVDPESGEGKEFFFKEGRGMDRKVDDFCRRAESAGLETETRSGYSPQSMLLLAEARDRAFGV